MRLCEGAGRQPQPQILRRSAAAEPVSFGTGGLYLEKFRRAARGTSKCRSLETSVPAA